MDIGRALGITWEWMVCMLFRPFRMKIWLGLGFVVLMTGAFSVVSPELFTRVENSRFFVGRVTPEVFSDWLTKSWPLAIASAPVLIRLFLLVQWISSVFDFVFIDDISRKSAAIREPFKRLSRLGTSFFLWQVVFGLIVVVVVGLPTLIGIAVMAGFLIESGTAAVGWQIPLVILVLYVVCLILVAVLIQSFTIDFALVIMYARNIQIIDAWKTLLPILKTNLVQVVYYTLFRILFALAMCVGMLADLIAWRVFAIPISLSSAVVFSAWLADGLRGYCLAILLAIMLCLPLWFCCAWLGCVLMLPVTVFIRSLPMVMLGQTDPLLVTIPLNSRHAQSPGNSPLG